MEQNNLIETLNHAAFKKLSISGINKLNSNIKFLKYKIGHPIYRELELSNNIQIIIDGEARLLGFDKDNKIYTFSKLGPHDFIGLASFLRGKSCEEISAKSEVKVVSFPDYIFLQLFQEEESFREWCNNTLFIAEIYSIYKSISQSLPNQILLKEKQLIYKNFNLRTINDQEDILLCKESFIYCASANIINQKCGELISSNENINIRPPLPGRFITITKAYQKELFYNENSKVEEKVLTDQRYETNINQNVSSLDLGQYQDKSKFKLIKGNGPLREAMACMEMLTKILDVPFRKDSIERIFRTEIKDEKTPSLQICGGIASIIGLHSTGLLIPAKLGYRIQTPSLIKWKNGLAILFESSPLGIVIASPSQGWINLKQSELEDIFEEGIELMYVEKKANTQLKRFGINWFLPSLKKYKNVLLQVLLASFIVQLFGLANPLLIQVIIDKVINLRSLDTLQILGFALVVVTIIGGILGGLRTFLFTETTNRIDTRLGAEVIDHLLRLPLNYFDKRPVGELGSRIAELEKIRNFLTGQALTTILDASFSLIYIVVMVLYSWLLTFIALAVVPIQIVLTLLGAPLIRRQIREVAEKNANTQSHLVEVLTGVQTVKAQNVETVCRWKWQNLYNKYISRTFDKTITGTILGETSKVLQQLSQLLVLWIGAGLVLQGQLTLGQLIAFRIISSYVTQPLLRLSNIWQSVQELRVSFDRLADIIDTQEESNEADKANIPIPEIKGSVRFENVNFSFVQEKVLKGINLEIPAGLFVGIAGQSGSGKSTLMKLLPRLYQPQEGRIFIDGYDINKTELYSLRRQIGIVPQEPLLFAGTVSENIALTEPDAESNEIVRAAKLASAHDFIMSLPQGYSTNVGERGSSLSGGQRQRIAIARTLLNKPKLLIMDEATSALDYVTEREVCENLRKSSQGITVFFITHRLTTIKNSDKILIMEKGNLAESGNHEELMNKKGVYYALYRQQE